MFQSISALGYSVLCWIFKHDEMIAGTFTERKIPRFCWQYSRIHVKLTCQTLILNLFYKTVCYVAFKGLIWTYWVHSCSFCNWQLSDPKAQWDALILRRCLAASVSQLVRTPRLSCRGRRWTARTRSFTSYAKAFSRLGVVLDGSLWKSEWPSTDTVGISLKRQFCWRVVTFLWGMGGDAGGKWINKKPSIKPSEHTGLPCSLKTWSKRIPTQDGRRAPWRGVRWQLISPVRTPRARAASGFPLSPRADELWRRREVSRERFFSHIMVHLLCFVLLCELVFVWKRQPALSRRGRGFIWLCLLPWLLNTARSLVWPQVFPL